MGGQQPPFTPLRSSQRRSQAPHLKSKFLPVSDIPTVDLNPAYSAFTPGAEGYIAFVLNPGPGEQYGWMRVTLTNHGTPGTIHEWASSDDLLFEVGQVPEPGILALLIGLAAFTILRRRNWRSAAHWFPDNS